MVMYPLSENVPMLSSELEESVGRMCVLHTGVRNCAIGSCVVADVLASCPKATVTFLLDGRVMSSLPLGLLK